MWMGIDGGPDVASRPPAPRSTHTHTHIPTNHTQQLQLQAPSLSFGTSVLYMQRPPALEKSTRPNLDKTLAELGLLDNGTLPHRLVTIGLEHPATSESPRYQLLGIVTAESGPSLLDEFAYPKQLSASKEVLLVCVVKGFLYSFIVCSGYLHGHTEWHLVRLHRFE